MRHHNALWKRLLLWIALSAALVAFLEGLRLAVEAPFSWQGTAVRWAFAAGLLVAARWTQPYSTGGRSYVWPWTGVLGAGVGVGGALVYAASGATWSAWVVLGALYLLLLGLDTVLARGLGGFWSWGARGLLALAGGIIPVSIAQIESHFADEEFFVLVQALALTLFSGLMLVIHLWLSAWQGITQGTTSRRGLCLNASWILIGLVFLAVAGGWATVRSYQASFYPPQAPTFEGISSDQPFLCSDIASSGEGHPDGEAVFQRLLARIEANPHKRPSEYGMLALGTGERRWAEAFRESLLGEAAERHFTGAANSVKSVQHDAALRVYYLWKVRQAFPDLFTEADQTLLRDWFTAINARALTVEWVDWMYALAFSKWPEGPYENQESGAGLLALLEVSGYAAPELSAADRDYLVRNERGWQQRFRNTDDALIYQPEWITNALFQSLYTGRLSERNQQHSLEWLLLQALPDGAVLRYNHPAHVPVAGVAYLGASLLSDPRLLWLAEQSLTLVEAEGRYLYAQPGLEAPVTFAGQPPTEASCLLYGDSGLPNQAGPLAPDKIVFRDGWSPNSAYTMLNLRFTGWHRYKATNTITLLYQAGPLAMERTLGQPFAWLPEGRSLFRDKRIPRENLNGLLIERTGMSGILYELIGLGGFWAQDPPHYARVERFETLGPLDVSRTVLDDWRGWRHERTIYFVHEEAIVVVDAATSRWGGGSAGVSWHLVGEGQREGESLWLREGESAARVVWPAEAWPPMTLWRIPADSSDQPNLHVLYHSPRLGRLDLATTWLIGEWADGQYQVTTLRAPGSDTVLGYHLRLSSTAGTLELLHNATPKRLEAGGLTTDGEAIVVWRKPSGETRVCAVGGSAAEVALAHGPSPVTTLEGKTLTPGETWGWRGGRLTIRNVGDVWCVKTR